ncbi:hypothetical protein EVJ58_g11058, partial [Rhodofomes roseus]
EADNVRQVPAVTGTREVHERMSLLASEFRKKMSDGMEFGQHGEYRAAFYQSVIEGAKNFVKKDSRIWGQNNKTVKTSAEELIRFLDPWKKARPDEPLVILCFDEAHMLTMSVAGEYDWTRFSELRRVLRMIVGWPIFTLFLSTVGKLEQFVPLPQQETSGRLAIRELGLFAPIVLTPFDILAERISKSNWTLQRVASTHHMAHLGRPLFAAMYDAGDADFQQDIVKFAGTKLLHSKTHPSSLTAMQSLACMGVRIPIHFHPTVPPDMVKERILVGQHLRLLLYAGLGFTSMITTCASEPLLAEVAYRVLGTRRWSAGEAVMIAPSERGAQKFSPPLQAVSEHLRDSYLDLGTRGETVAAVLLLDARDRATTFPLAPNELPPGTDDGGDKTLRYDGARERRIVTVSHFLKALLAKPCHDITPLEYHHVQRAEVRLETAFKDCFIYFNHYIKATSFEVVNQAYLRLAISRGAALICADNQAGVDIIIPCLRRSALSWC